MKWFMKCMILLALGLVPTVAPADLTIEMVTWNTVGLDANKPDKEGPNRYLCGARVTNTGVSTVNNIVSTFNWTSANAYINLAPTALNHLEWPSLAQGEHIDFYYDLFITRVPAAFDTARGFYITASGDGVPTVQTPGNREIFVEHLVEQNRNSVLSVLGPTTVFEGGTFQFVLNADTATNGYEQMTATVDFPNFVFQIRSIYTSYTAPPNAFNDKVYGDACGWDNDTTSPTYRSCIGPVQYGSGKVGGVIRTIYEVEVIDITSPDVTIMPVIYDFSGSSYHYNLDFNAGDDNVIVFALNPTIAGRVFRDYTQNLVLEPRFGESGIAGVEVDIYTPGSGGIFGDGNDVLFRPLTTDASGAFYTEADDVIPDGLYQSRVNTADIPVGLTYVTGQQTYTFSVTGGNITYLNTGYSEFPLLAVIGNVTITKASDSRSFTVKWTTSSEVDNMGFRVYRAMVDAEGKIGTVKEVTDTLIPAQGWDGSGSNYSLMDDYPVQQNEMGRVYYIEDTDLLGQTTIHGPYSTDGRFLLKDSGIRDWSMMN